MQGSEYTSRWEVLLGDGHGDRILSRMGIHSKFRNVFKLPGELSALREALV